MTTYLYCIKDLNAKYYMQPMFMRSDSEAKRAFQIACEDENSFLSKFPNQFDLVKIGSFEDTSAALTESYEWLCNGNDFARKED